MKAPDDAILALVVNIRDDDYDVFIGRPSKYGNPFVIGRDGTRAQVCKKYQQWVEGQIRAPDGSKPPTMAEIVRDLRGKRLGCFCAPRQCHGWYLAGVANAKRGKGLFG
jgi:hypothetical protein